MRFQFSIRTALVAIALLAPLCLYVAACLKKRPDFVLPTQAEYAAKLKEWETQSVSRGTATVPTKKTASQHAQDLVANFPPLGIEHWEATAKHVESGMHEWALYRHLPSANIGISFLRPGKNTQVLVYAVDSEFAALCEVTVEGGTGPSSLTRVVKFHGFAKHNLACDEWGSLCAKDMTFNDDDDASLVFVNK
ncbi:secreted protein [Rhodopirellula maiorica SM1]|uniref:Secreted protein n=1 Tax=Rhodopirellula maiorica SM1 TaxID=1265738 RepID=M5RUP7_9BACT|nr:hypothetical protein [Rhodopirellula maiorica]EMI19117.1 secreted protein [Rhodopirellula maiorica SM1]